MENESKNNAWSKEDLKEYLKDINTKIENVNQWGSMESYLRDKKISSLLD